MANGQWLNGQLLLGGEEERGREGESTVRKHKRGIKRERVRESEEIIDMGMGDREIKREEREEGGKKKDMRKNKIISGRGGGGRQEMEIGEKKERREKNID